MDEIRVQSNGGIIMTG